MIAGIDNLGVIPLPALVPMGTEHHAICRGTERKAVGLLVGEVSGLVQALDERLTIKHDTNAKVLGNHVAVAWKLSIH